MNRLAFTLLLTVPVLAQETQPPNIVVIVSDDAGYADFSMHGSAEIATPRIDSIAANGVGFAQGYVSASVCSPSRAGLMTGRYQQRFGHERNIPPRFSDENGLPIEEETLGNAMQASGYRTIALGKWHLGYADHFHPLARGFDDFFGFLQGARSFFPLDQPTKLNRLLRDWDVVDEEFEYMTDELGLQAAEYIARRNTRPFLLYLAFNAVHTPMHVKPGALEGLAPTEKPKRRKLIAMTHALDAAVGTVLDALDQRGLTENTLVFFVNDNGGATNNASRNGELRGQKGSPFEGGIRVPFVVQWPKVLPKGVIYKHPVSTLDILPTCLAAAGSEWQSKQPLDGVDLLRYLRGDEDGEPHPTLYWRRGENAAVRAGDLKLVRHKAGDWMLFDLVRDPREQHDLAAEREADVKWLRGRYENWQRSMVAPRW